MPSLGVHSFALTSKWHPAEADRLLPNLVEHGASLIEIALLDPANFDAAGTRRAVERNQMALACSLALPSFIDLQRDLQSACAFLGEGLNVARTAGANLLTGIIYGTPGKTSGQPRSRAETEALLRLLDKTAAHAKTLNMTLGIEPCHRYETHLINTAAEAVRLIERIGSANLIVHLNTYHMNSEESGMAAAIKIAGEHLGTIHLSESHRGVPGHGTLDWSDVFSGLKAIDFEGIMTLESFVHAPPDLKARYALWRSVVEDPDDVIALGLPFIRAKAGEAGLLLEI